MPMHDILVIGGSAGGVDAAARLIGGLPADLPAAVFLVIHFPETATSVLPRILNRRGPLPARHPSDGDAIVPGHVYVAPPGCHLLLDRGHVRLTRGPRENGHRPAIDPLFRTAARSYGARVIGVILSGNLDDGTAGLLRIRRAGGITVAQDPDECLYPGMPRSAIEHGAVEHVVSLAAMPQLLTSLVHEPVEEVVPMSASLDSSLGEPLDPEAAEHDPVGPGIPGPEGPPSGLTCPECHGSLFEQHDGELLRYRCRIGHAFSPDSLLSEQAGTLEAALWTALRALEEHAALARRMSAGASRRGHLRTASTFTEQAVDAEHHASVIRQVLESGLSRPELEAAVESVSANP